MATKKEPVSTLKSPKALKSYLARIEDASEASSLASFASFPKETEFAGQDRGENIILLIRQHPVVFIPQLLIAVLMIIVPVLVSPVINLLNVELTAGDKIFGMGLLVLWALLTVSLIAVTFFKWYFNVNIVTNERIVDIDFDKLFDHRVSEAQLEKIEDVSHSAVGMWAIIFDYGSVYVQTAAEQREFEFKRIPRPRDVQDTINDLLELKQSRND